MPGIDRKNRFSKPAVPAAPFTAARTSEQLVLDLSRIILRVDRSEHPWLCAGAYLLALVPIIGCSSSQDCTVAGKVTFEEQPLEDGLIRFRPIGGGHGGDGQAKIESGAYRVEHLPAGDYRVWIMAEKKTGRKIPSPDAEPNRAPPLEDEVVQIIPIEYNARSRLRVTLAAGDNHHDFKINK